MLFFKQHLDYAVKKLTSLRNFCDTIYDRSGVQPPDFLWKDASAYASHFHFRDQSEEVIYKLIDSSVCHAQWAKCGLNTFDPTDSLSAGLMMTTPSTEPGFPHLPYSSFFVRVPPRYLPLWNSEDHEEPDRWIEGLLVNLTHLAGQYGPCLRIEAVSTSSEKSENVLILKIMESNVESPARFIELVDTLTDERLTEDGARGIDPSIPEKDIASKMLAFKFISNLCSWLESIGGLGNRIPSNKQGKTSKKELDLTAEPRIVQWILGQEVKLSAELLASARESIATIRKKKPVGGWKLKSLHTVRGHIRHQAYGPKHSERKVIWIKPFTQGPRGGDVIAHIYKAQKKPEN
jgi:hypothetical protein